KTRITIRLDDDLIAWFRDQAEANGGGNYQTLINAALREYVSRQKEPTLSPEQMELLVRQAVREELAQYRLTS
ncbi:MAG: BrnA antitoxin family protein, partial [Anaerolineales bacterium]|nr:BrnA antitoxin family protein [Anaerolineales bacterium]